MEGRVSEDSAIDLGDVITDEEEIVEELIKRGMFFIHNPEYFKTPDFPKSLGTKEL